MIPVGAAEPNHGRAGCRAAIRGGAFSVTEHRIPGGPPREPSANITHAPTSSGDDRAPETRGRAAPRQTSARRVCWGVSLLSLAVYLLSANGHLQGPDQEYFYLMARALALNRSFAIEQWQTGPGTAGARGVDGQFYAQYAPGLPLTLAPLVALGHGLAEPIAAVRPRYRWGHQDEADLAARFLVSYVNAPVTAATAGLLALLVVRLGYPPSAAALTGLAFALASPAWGQARSLFAEPLQGLLLVLAWLTLFRATATRAVLGGGALALAILVKLTSVVALPAFLLLPDSRGRAIWRAPGRAVPLLGAGLVALAFHGLYNFARFGNPLTTGYTTGGGGGLDFGGSPLVGLYGLLFSPGRGIFGYAPALLAAVWAYDASRKQHPAVGSALAALVIPWLLVHAFWRDWDAGWGWGPRYLLPILPIALAPLAICWLHPRARLAALGLIVLGAIVQLPGATVDFMAWGSKTLEMHGQQCVECGLADYRLWRFMEPAQSDIIGHAKLMLAGELDLAWLLFRGTWVTPLTLGSTLALSVAGLALLKTNGEQPAVDAERLALPEADGERSPNPPRSAS
jgi:hypothetical protein